MPISCDAIISGSTKYISTDQYDEYNCEIYRISSISIGTLKRTGGFWRPRLGSIDIIADTFGGSQPPNTITLPLEIQDNSHTTYFTIQATGKRAGTVNGITTYDLAPPEYSDVESSGAISSSTLFDYFTTCCGAGRLNRTLNTTNATNCNISVTLSSDRDTIAVLHDLAESVNHTFYDDGSTIYLLDALKDSGVSHAFDAGYGCTKGYPIHESPDIYSRFIGGAYSVAGSYANGDEFTRSFLHHTAQTDIEAQLTRAKTVLDKKWITAMFPLQNAVSVKFGDEIVITDQENNETLTFIARNFNYSIADLQTIVIEGEGTVT